MAVAQDTSSQLLDAIAAAFMLARGLLPLISPINPTNPINPISPINPINPKP